MKKFEYVLIMATSLMGCGSNPDGIAEIPSSNSPAVDIYANQWSLREYGENSETMVDVIAETHYELHFSADMHNVSGTVDCNAFESSFSVSRGELSIDFIAPTEMLCPYLANATGDALQKYMDQNAIITLALSTINHFEIEEDRLIIHSVAGEILSYQLKVNE